MNSRKKIKIWGDMCAHACVIGMLVSMCWCQRRYQVSCSITVCFISLRTGFSIEPRVVLVASKPHWSFSHYLYIELGLQYVYVCDHSQFLVYVLWFWIFNSVLTLWTITSASHWHLLAGIYHIAKYGISVLEIVFSKLIHGCF